MMNADVLNMNTLVKDAIAHFTDNIEEFSRIPDDMSGLNDKTFRFIAQNVNIERIDSLNMRGNKFVDRLFYFKLEQLL